MNFKKLESTTRYVNITTFNAGEGFFISIEFDMVEHLYNCWLWHEDYAVKEQCASVKPEQFDSEGRFLNELPLDCDIEWYKDEHINN